MAACRANKVGLHGTNLCIAVISVALLRASSAAELPAIERAWQLASEAANDTCGRIPTGGADAEAKLKADATAKLPGILKKLGSVEGSAELQGGAYQGPTQKDFARVVESTQQCRMTIAQFIFGKISENRTAHVSSRKQPRIPNHQPEKSQDKKTADENLPGDRLAVAGSNDISFVATAAGDPEHGTPSYKYIITYPGRYEKTLILNQPRDFYHLGHLTFVGRNVVENHKQVALKSEELWQGLFAKVPTEERPNQILGATIWVPVNGEPVYVTPSFNASRVTYNLTVTSLRDPSDGSPPRITVVLVRDPDN